MHQSMRSLTFIDILGVGLEEVGRQEEIAKTKKYTSKKVGNMCYECFFFAGRSLQFRDLPDISLHTTHLPLQLYFYFLAFFLSF